MQISIQYQPTLHKFTECKLLGEHLETEAIELASGLSVGYNPETITAEQCVVCNEVIDL